VKTGGATVGSCWGCPITTWENQQKIHDTWGNHRKINKNIGKSWKNLISMAILVDKMMTSHDKPCFETKPYYNIKFSMMVL